VIANQGIDRGSLEEGLKKELETYKNHPGAAGFLIDDLVGIKAWIKAQPKKLVKDESFVKIDTKTEGQDESPNEDNEPEIQINNRILRRDDDAMSTFSVDSFASELVASSSLAQDNSNSV